MKELKIEHITTSHGDTFAITRGETTITLSPDEALMVLQFLYSRIDEITRLVNGLETSGETANPYQLSDGFIEAVIGNIGEDGEPYATQNTNDPAYWNAPGIDEGPAHYNPRAGLETEHGGREWWEADNDKENYWLDSDSEEARQWRIANGMEQ